MLLAKRIAHVLVEEALVACASLGAPCLSMYMWDGTLVGRSEEHTSELQSLMRSSYAVFCLNKKKTNSQEDDEHNSENLRLSRTITKHEVQNYRYTSHP